ncbi:hypothetical protein C8J57DRAFT_1444874, partial [Mycena rebaudengoi]
MNGNPQSLEDASTIVSEFIYSLDNLPNEVAHLLQEIKEKEIRAQGNSAPIAPNTIHILCSSELQQEIDRDSAKYIRHSLRSSSASSSATVSPSPSASRAPSPKSSLLPAKINAAYSEINELSTDKCALAQRIIELVARTRARLDADLTKVRVLQGEIPDQVISAPSRLTRAPTLVSSPMVEADPYPLGMRNPAAQISESLRVALTSSASMPDIRQVPIPPPLQHSASISAAGPAQKSIQPRLILRCAYSCLFLERRIGSTSSSSSIKLAPVASPTPPRRSASPLTSASALNAHTSHSHKRSRLSRQIHPREDIDVDADGEEDGEGEDENLYCFCQKQSYGDMIACDNDNCPYEWFHLSCVQLTQPTPEKWYCRECVDKGFAAETTGTRKG